MEILTTHTYYLPVLLAYKWILITLAAIIIISVITVIALDDDHYQIGIAMLSVMIASVGLLFVFWFIPTKKIDYIEYLVTFDDDYTINEVYKNYEIISVDGDIYTLRGINGGNNG